MVYSHAQLAGWLGPMMSPCLCIAPRYGCSQGVHLIGAQHGTCCVDVWAGQAWGHAAPMLPALAPAPGPGPGTGVEVGGPIVAIGPAGDLALHSCAAATAVWIRTSLGHCGRAHFPWLRAGALRICALRGAPPSSICAYQAPMGSGIEQAFPDLGRWQERWLRWRRSLLYPHELPPRQGPGYRRSQGRTGASGGMLGGYTLHAPSVQTPGTPEAPPEGRLDGLGGAGGPSWPGPGSGGRPRCPTPAWPW